MIDNCESAVTTIMNLINAAHWHKAHCDSECAVSLSLLQQAARDLAWEFLDGEDKVQMDALIDDMPV